MMGRNGSIPDTEHAPPALLEWRVGQLEDEQGEIKKEQRVLRSDYDKALGAIQFVKWAIPGLWILLSAEIGALWWLFSHSK